MFKPLCTITLSILSLPILMAKERPNIILFLVDDMGWQDTSVPFWRERTPLNDLYRTPNMERLAAKGVKFTQAYACPVSSPSRVSLLTGANVAQHKVSNWTLRANKSTDAPNKWLTFGRWNWNGMSPIADTPDAFLAKALPLILRENGYLTAIVGKAHFGAQETPAADPLQIGFEYNIGGHAAGGMGSYLGEKNYGNVEPGEWTKPWGVPNLESYHGTDTFLTQALTIEGIKIIDRAITDHRPFFLYMSHYAVHLPYAADKRFYNHYIDRGISPKEAEYASLIEGMDKSLGDLMECLDQREITDNTIIIFLSDNGGYTVGRGGEAAERNYPLRGGKGACFEGGTRVPMLLYWPDITTGGDSNDTPVIIEDLFPTILEMAQVKDYKTPQQIDGKSVVACLKGGKGDYNRPLYFHFPNHWGERKEDVGAPQSAIRVGQWKLIHYYESGSNELYNIELDIAEKHNLRDQPRYQKIAEKLAKKLSNYLRKEGASMPFEKSSGTICRYPDGMH